MVAKSLEVRIGEKSSRLTILEYDGRAACGSRRFKAMCDCGNICTVLAKQFRSGAKRSCGCLFTETITKHKYSRSREYAAWLAMLNRCYNEKNESYADYGGRGILVDASWHFLNIFMNDMAPKPPGTELDRIDTNGPYSKENCRWATRVENSRNKRNSIYVEHEGRSIHLKELAEITGIGYSTLLYRHDHGKDLLERVRQSTKKASKNQQMMAQQEK